MHQPGQAVEEPQPEHEKLDETQQRRERDASAWINGLIAEMARQTWFTAVD